LGAGSVSGVGLVAWAALVAFGFGVGLGLGLVPVEVVAGWEAGVFAFGAEAVASPLAGRAARLSLRRCGRRCGSAERTSEEDEFRSVMASFRRC
jgi:hypothetical protein